MPMSMYRMCMAQLVKPVQTGGPDSNSGVSDQSVGSSPGRGTCVLEQDTFVLLWNTILCTSEIITINS